MRNKFFILLLVSVVFIQSTYQDVYLHNPRGSNNRLNENTPDRKHNNRVFDSQVIIYIFY
jgi:hypothetical protein